MARRTRIVLEDDLSGEVLDEGRGETLSFGLDGQSYEIDLSGENSAEMRASLKRYVDVARKVSSSRRRDVGRAPQRSASGKRMDTTAIREWARANGHEVSDRGRVTASVVQAYDAAH
ncbi:histone-like nucleoid-structuring protein Lsr2 [Blastococcus sp. VKM Ac-2987]|uniref:histone-like nucleoid-structuring protein Lsr2 n=1 Tax=Blastococcus sp. VKM Ac-2987 TaxID=3004141 RepID=UPI0022AB8FE1|nr:Lsr2 family protein [Blastococcus sp. VKM Ac-2987]MCZ2857413.1 Lsr2 family protein [Blastococcus sp. VKM Ac-2987]